VSLETLRKLPTAPADLRRFGWAVGGVLTVVGLVVWRRHPGVGLALVAIGSLLLALGTAWPRALKCVYVAWMALGLVLGHIVSTVLLVLIFYAVVTPLGLLARIWGKDFLDRKWDPQAPSYWIPRKPAQAQTRADYERQF